MFKRGISILLLLSLFGCSTHFSTKVDNGRVICERQHRNCVRACQDENSLPGAIQQGCLDRCFESKYSCRTSQEGPLIIPTPPVGW